MIEKIVGFFKDDDVNRQFDLILKALADLQTNAPGIEQATQPGRNTATIDQQRLLTYDRYLRYASTTGAYSTKLLPQTNLVTDGTFDITGTTAWDYDSAATHHETTGGYTGGRAKFTASGALESASFIPVSDGDYYLIGARIKVSATFRGTVRFRLNVYDAVPTYLEYSGSALIKSTEISTDGYMRYLALVEISNGSATQAKPAVDVTMDTAGEVYVDDFWCREVGTDIFNAVSALGLTWNAQTYGLITNPPEDSETVYRPDEWTHNIPFSSVAYNDLTWGAGTITLPTAYDGETDFSVGASNVTLSAGKNYIYVDLDTFTGSPPSGSISTSTTWPIAGWGRATMLLGVAQPNSDTGSTASQFAIFGGSGDQMITADWIAADAVTANAIKANSIAAVHIQADAVEADKIAPLTGTDVVVGNATTDGNLRSHGYTAPTGTAQGAGWRLSADEGIEAYGAGHVFGGPMYFSTGSFLVSIGSFLADTSKQYPSKADFTSSGRVYVYRWVEASTRLDNEPYDKGAYVVGSGLTVAYMCTTAGTTAGTEPSGFASEDEQVNDGTASWGRCAEYTAPHYEVMTTLGGNINDASPYNAYFDATWFPFATGAYFVNDHNYAVSGFSRYGHGVNGGSTNGYGLRCQVSTATGKAPILIAAATTATVPSHSASKGSVWITSDGDVYVNTNGSTGWSLIGDQMSTRWNDALAPASTLKTTGVGVPSFTQIGTSAKFGYEFSDEGAAAGEKRGYVSVQLPHGYVAGGEIRFHLHLCIDTVPATDETIEFEFTYSWDNAVDDVPSSTTITKTLDITTSMSANQTVILGFDAITGTGMNGSSILGGTIRRLSAGANDNYSGSVWLESSDAHIQVDSIGSVAEYPT